MSALDRSGTYKTPCPKCNGKVSYFFYDGDCRYNPPTYDIHCKKCGKKFTVAEWQKLEDKKKPRPVKSNTESDGKKANRLRKNFANIPIGKLKGEEYPAFHKLMTLAEIPPKSDIALLEKAVREIENGTR